MGISDISEQCVVSGWLRSRAKQLQVNYVYIIQVYRARFTPQKKRYDVRPASGGAPGVISCFEIIKMTKHMSLAQYAIYIYGRTEYTYLT